MSGAALLLLLAASAAPAPPIADGIYSDVRVSERTGDLLGMEVQVIGAAQGEASVEAVLCEGWCNEVVRAPLTRTADGWIFSYALPAGPGEPPFVQQVLLRPKGRRVEALVRFDPAAPPLRHRLQRVDEPFGLAVARSGN